ncbi:MAG TPA: glycosyltransferase family 39 protein [Blastocatellia bacterium]|nr:glycosyltransferase family 39 protein [Blastocatellia bacterium]
MIVLFLASVILFSHLHEGGLNGYDDAFYAHEGKEMLRTGEWWSVRYNGNLNFEYPPMFIWLEALSMKVLGVSDFAAKFPSAFSALLIIMLVFFLARELGAEFLPAICASWVLMLSQYFMKWAMHAMTDAPFILFFTLALYWYVKGLKSPNYLILCGPVIGAAILTRSVIGLIPIGIIAGHLVLTGQYRKFLSIRLWAGLSIAVLVPGLWYFSQYLLHGDQFLAGHSGFVGTKMGVGGGRDATALAGGLLQYPLWLLRFYWPWLPFMVFGLVVQLKRAIRERESSAILLVLWALLVVGPFSLAQYKVLRYILPAFPAFALLAAGPVASLISLVRRRVYLQVAYAVAIIAVFLIGCFPKPMMRAEDMMALAPVVMRQTDPSLKVTIYTSAEDHINYIPQFLWYSNRFCTRVTESDKLLESLRSEDEQVFIMEAGDYRQWVLNSGVRVELIMSTRKLICFKTVATPRAGQNV